MKRFSVACRPIEKAGVTVKAGHGGRWAHVEGLPCPICSRPMVTTGVTTVTDLTKEPRA